MIIYIVGAFSILFLLYVLVNERKYKSIRRSKKSLLKEFDGYILEVRHFFYRSGVISYAVREAAERAQSGLKPYVRRVADIVEESYFAADTDIFSDVSISKQLKTFLLLAQNVAEYGDMPAKDGESGFLQNLLYIRMDLKTELRLLEKSEHLFMGYVMTSAVPAAAMPFIASWAVSAIPQLTGFYYGRNGALLSIAIIVLTCFCYSSVIRLREGRNLRPKSFRMLDTVVERSFIGTAIERIIVRNYTRALRHKEMLRRLGERCSVTVLYFRQLLALFLGIAVLLVVYLDNSMENSMRVIDYFIIPLTAAGAFFYPYVVLKLRSAISADNMQEEMVDLQTALAMMAGCDGASAVSMLETMESFSDIFKPAIRRCIDNFIIDERRALDRLKQEEHYEAFGRLIDCFYMIEDIGVDGAFGEISDDRKNFREYRNQENEFLLEDRANLAMLLAILPGLMILFIYLLIPFMTEALGMFESYAVNIEGAL